MVTVTARERVVGGILAGLVGGIVLSVFLTIMNATDGSDVWVGAKIAGAPFLGARALQPGFDAEAVLIGVASHLGVSMAWGLVFGLLVGGFPGTAVVLAGIVWGVVVWLGMYRVALPLLGLSQIAASVPLPQAILQHQLFGLSVAFAFLGFRGPREQDSELSPRIEPRWTDAPSGAAAALPPERDASRVRFPQRV